MMTLMKTPSPPFCSSYAIVCFASRPTVAGSYLQQLIIDLSLYCSLALVTGIEIVNNRRILYTAN